jgi:type II secretory ATPase GspE/PulE/Tfp pilus assembly ATPase PilB-like protein
MEQSMPNLMIAAVEFGGYISIFKFVIFLALFFAWLPLVSWVYQDAKGVGAKETTWTGIVFGAGAVGAIAWMLIPIFIVGVLFYVLAVAGTALAYVKHRNARVLDFDRVLTADHIKSVLSRQDKMEELSGFLFITANKNEVPTPEAKTPEFVGYKLAYDILSDAIWRRASSIAFMPASQNYNVVYNVDGAALKQPAIPREQMEYLIRFLKQLGDLDVNEKRKPQTSKFRTRQNKDNRDWEITTAGSTAGEQVRLKQVTKEGVIRLNEIGLMPDQLEPLSKFRELRQGLFLVTGPRKSGVTTTLYALLRNHDAFINSINTLEKRPTGDLPNITQNVFSPSDTGTTTFAKKLQMVVRMGPDIVGVGDCEDAETAQIATAAAADGKVVYVSMNADSVVQALGKWIKLVGSRKSIADTLLGVSNQRLLRQLCSECKQAYAPNKDLFRKYNIAAEKVKALYRVGKVVYDKRGKPRPCDNCQETGYVGRTGIFEIIIMNDELRKVIRKSKSLSEMSSQFRRAKMLYLQEQALRKVINGTTAINEMLRVLTPRKKQNAKKT